jgi:hypothetical protein
MTPYPAVPGATTTINSTGSSSETVTGGSYKIVIYLDGLPVDSFNGAACSLAPKCPCPCAPGSYYTLMELKNPSFAPAGRYTSTTNIYDQNGDDVICINASFDMS